MLWRYDEGGHNRGGRMTTEQLTWIKRRGQIKHLLYEHYLNGRITKADLKEQFEALNEVEPIKHGRWEFNPKTGKYRCSACKKDETVTPWGRPSFNYCPNCGAIMDEVEE